MGRIIRGKERKLIFTIAIVVSIVLYLAGVFSGLYASRVIEERTKEDLAVFRAESKKDIGSLKSETEEDLEILSNYVDLLELNLKIMQLEQSFVETLSHEQMCAFSSITTQGLLNELSYYWDKLPYRIEEYEKNNILTEEYLLLKDQYTQLSVRTWIHARNKYHKCKGLPLPVLYFYSSDCTSCIEQGEELDKFKIDMEDKQVLVFTVDTNSDDLIINYLKEYYKITKVPAIILNDNVLQGELFSANRLQEEVI